MLVGDFKRLLLNKRVLVTGACGTVGKYLVKKLVNYNLKELRLLDNNESELFFLMETYGKHINITCFLGDIRDKEKIYRIAKGIDIIFHCAAYKHVILSEYNPFDVIQTNLIGTQNIILAAIDAGVKIVINTSTDKAVNPTNVMGATKLLSEKLITAANVAQYGHSTIFSSVRFGNVIGSRGSVVQVFIKQIKNGGPVTLTDKRMTRFVMTFDEAADLVLKSAYLARGGEVFVTKMQVIKIEDLAKAMIELLAPRFGYDPEEIEIQEIGAKPGEKLYEELMTEEEMRRSLELEDMFVILPAFKHIYARVEYSYPGVVKTGLDRPYISSQEKPMSYEDLKEYLISHRVLEHAMEEVGVVL